ncbi:MAG: S-methyl-5-thioribose-1-phosphate isomerase [Dehalococcoidia bacterium]
MDPFTPVAIERPLLRAIDQTLLPGEERWLVLKDLDSVCEAVSTLRVRGAPLLGIVGAAGVAVAAEISGTEMGELRRIAERIGSVRPTAVELATGAEGAVIAAEKLDAPQRLDALWAHAQEYAARRVAEDRALGEFGAALLPDGAAVLTHCNAGALATGGIGTALGVVQVAWEQGRLSRCFATETRPLLQGARLTAWELARAGIPATLLPDTAAASLIASGQVQAVVTGADRIAANGDSANKIGTYGLASVAARHGVPFYIAAPRTTFDPGCASGAEIPIEYRNGREVGGFGSQRWSPDGIDAYNPAFDVTPAELIAAIVTEAGVVSPPFEEGIRAILRAP